MKTVYGRVCPSCESVRACSQFGCGPIEQDTKRARLSLRGAVWIGAGIAGLAAWTAAVLAGAHWLVP